MEIKRGEIFYANLSPVVGSEQDGIRPVLVVQNDVGNRYSQTVIVVPITSRNKTDLPTHVMINGEEYGLDKISTILVEQVRTLDKTRLMEKIGKLDDEVIEKVKKALKINFGIRMDLEALFDNW